MNSSQLIFQTPLGHLEGRLGQVNSSGFIFLLLYKGKGSISTKPTQQKHKNRKTHNDIFVIICNF